jgi:hypothetical protein
MSLGDLDELVISCGMKRPEGMFRKLAVDPVQQRRTVLVDIA